MIYGTRAVMEAIRAGRDIENILIQKGTRNELISELLDLARKDGLPFNYVPEQKMAGLSNKNHQGVIALLSAVHFESVENIVHGIFSDGRDPFLLILDRVTDVRNFGAIVRTAETAGVNAIVIPEKGSAPISADASLPDQKPKANDTRIKKLGSEGCCLYRTRIRNNFQNRFDRAPGTHVRFGRRRSITGVVEGGRLLG